MEKCLLKENKFKCRVSSVLNKNVKSYGQQHMFDESDETCWNSDAGTPQWILINFDKECIISTFDIEFQGGFAGKDCHIEIGHNENMKIVKHFYPDNTNAVQRFSIEEVKPTKAFKLVINESTDLFGRIIVYRLSLYS